MHATTTNIIFENAEFFVANLDNGGVRFGLFGCPSFDFPAGHKEFSRVQTMDVDDAEEIYDEYFLRYIPMPTDGYRNA